MATGGTPFDDNAEELHNWTVTNGSLEDRLNNTVRAHQNCIHVFPHNIAIGAANYSIQPISS